MKLQGLQVQLCCRLKADDKLENSSFFRPTMRSLVSWLWLLWIWSTEWPDAEVSNHFSESLWVDSLFLRRCLLFLRGELGRMFQRKWYPLANSFGLPTSPRSRHNVVALHRPTWHWLERSGTFVFQQLSLIVFRKANKQIITVNSHEHVSVDESWEITKHWSCSYTWIDGNNWFEVLNQIGVRFGDFQYNRSLG